MSAITNAIHEKTSSMNRKEKELADFILEHAREIVHMGITELAERSGASTATISRFCKQLHFSGYAEFKVKLSAELAGEAAAPAYQDIVAGRPLTDIIAAVESNHLRAIGDTARLIDRKALERAVLALRSARQIGVYGMATSGLVAQDFHQKLVRIGRSAHAFSDHHMMLTSASNLTADDAAICISYSGRTAETISALRCARESGAVTISLTKFGSNPLADLADIALFTSPLEEGMRRGDMASRITQLFLVDILFVALISDQFEEYVPRLERSFQMVRKYT